MDLVSFARNFAPAVKAEPVPEHTDGASSHVSMGLPTDSAASIEGNSFAGGRASASASSLKLDLASLKKGKAGPTAVPTLIDLGDEVICPLCEATFDSEHVVVQHDALAKM